MPDIKFAVADVAAMKLGTANVSKVMLGTVEIWPGAGACTDVLAEPFNNLTAWTNTTGATIVAGGRTGNGAQITGASSGTEYRFPAPNESAYVTVGFAFKLSSLAAARFICALRSDAGVTAHLSFLTTTTTGAIKIRRGTSSGTVLYTGGPSILTVNTWHYVEIQAYLHDSAGTVVVRVDGVEKINIGPVNTRNAGTKAVFDTVRIGGATGVNAFYDDLYLSTGVGCAFKGSITIPQEPTMDNISLNTIANIVTAVCAILITIKIY